MYFDPTVPIILLTPSSQQVPSYCHGLVGVLLSTLHLIRAACLSLDVELLPRARVLHIGYTTEQFSFFPQQPSTA